MKFREMFDESLVAVNIDRGPGLLCDGRDLHALAIQFAILILKIVNRMCVHTYFSLFFQRVIWALTNAGFVDPKERLICTEIAGVKRFFTSSSKYMDYFFKFVMDRSAILLPLSKHSFTMTPTVSCASR